MGSGSYSNKYGIAFTYLVEVEPSSGGGVIATNDVAVFHEFLHIKFRMYYTRLHCYLRHETSYQEISQFSLEEASPKVRCHMRLTTFYALQ